MQSLYMYKTGLVHRSVFFNGKLPGATFTNIVSSGIGANEFEWTKSFIEEYGFQLDETTRMDAITYSWAIWNFHQNEFEETIKLILNYPFSKPLQIILSKTILIRTYVELFLQDDSYYELSIAQINTFEKYIRNNKIFSETVAKGYLNFARHTKKMVNLKIQKKDLSPLEKKLQDTQDTRLKSWLLEKLKPKTK